MRKWWLIGITFFKRDLKIRYVDTALGGIWVLLLPLSLTAISWLVFSLAFKQHLNQVPYFLYVLTGLISWQYFASSLNSATRCLINNRNLVSNTKFPLEIIIISSVFSRMIDFLFSLGLLLIIILFVNHSTGAINIALVLSLLLTQTIWLIGLSLIISSLNIFYRDVQKIIEISLRLLFYLTPIVYPLTVVPDKIAKYLKLNPINLMIDLYRQILLYSNKPWNNLGLFTLIGTVFLMIGFLVFGKLKNKIIEKV